MANWLCAFCYDCGFENESCVCGKPAAPPNDCWGWLDAWERQALSAQGAPLGGIMALDVVCWLFRETYRVDIANGRCFLGPKWGSQVTALADMSEVGATDGATDERLRRDVVPLTVLPKEIRTLADAA